MKLAYLGVILLLAVSVIAIAGDVSSPAPAKDQPSNTAITQSGQKPDGQIQTPAQTDNDKKVMLLTPAEVDSLQVKGDSLLAQSGVNQIQVGAISTTDLIYILVVVLLVVVILRVAAG